MSEEAAVAAAEDQPVEGAEEQPQEAAPVEEGTPPIENGGEEPPVEGEQPPPKGRDAQSRIDELTWRAKVAEEKANEYRDMYERSRAPQEEPQAKEEPKLDLPPAPVMPDRFDYDSDEDFTAAKQKFQHDNAMYFNTIIEKREQAAIAKQQNTARQNVMSQRQQTLTQKLSAGREKYHDFDMVMANPQTQYSETMIEGLTDAENSADIAYHLGQNPQEAAKIMQMPPLQQVMAIGKLDVQVAAAKPKTTKAPPPSEPVAAGSSGAVVDPDKMTADEWRKWRDGGGTY
jgi:hypothetical protein